MSRGAKRSPTVRPRASLAEIRESDRKHEETKEAARAWWDRTACTESRDYTIEDIMLIATGREHLMEK
jgi:hypothetical protein